jgi:hypothetical protein
LDAHLTNTIDLIARRLMDLLSVMMQAAASPACSVVTLWYEAKWTRYAEGVPCPHGMNWIMGESAMLIG